MLKLFDLSLFDGNTVLAIRDFESLEMLFRELQHLNDGACKVEEYEIKRVRDILTNYLTANKCPAVRLYLYDYMSKTMVGLRCTNLRSYENNGRKIIEIGELFSSEVGTFQESDMDVSMFL